MSEAKQATFSFQNFRVLKSVLSFTDIKGIDFKINISPKGEYSKSKKIYTLILDVKVDTNLNANVITIVAESKFFLDEQIQDEIPAYFTLNAPAITFPYIRAYIAALTSLSGIGTMNLPILNLVDLIEKLKENYSVTE